MPDTTVAPIPGTPIFAPDGSVRQIPDAQIQDAMKSGGKLAVQMKAPDGSLRYVPHDQVRDAQLAGGQVSPMQGTPDAPKPAEGFWHSVGSAIGLTPEAFQAAQQKAANMNPVQEALSSTAPPNPVDVVKSTGNAVVNEFQKGSQEGQQSYDALQHGDIKGFIAHQIGQVGHAGATVAAPVMGEGLSKAGEQYGAGNIKGGLGTTVGLLAPIVAGSVLKRAFGQPPEQAAAVPPQSVKFTDVPDFRPQPGQQPPQNLLKSPGLMSKATPQPTSGLFDVVPPDQIASPPSAIIRSMDSAAIDPKTSSQNLDLPRTNSGEGVLTQALTALDNKSLLKVARSRGIDVSAESQLKPGVADNRVIKKIIDDFSPEELQDVQDQGIEMSRHTPVQAEGVSPEAGKETWHYKVLSTFFPDVSIPKAMAARSQAVIANRPTGPGLMNRAAIRDIEQANASGQAVLPPEEPQASPGLISKAKKGKGGPSSPAQATPAAQMPPVQAEAPQPQLATADNTEDLLRQSLKARGIDPDAKQPYSGPERRTDENLPRRKRLDEMTEAEKDQELLTAPKTGLPNSRAFDESGLEQSHPHVGFADMDNFKQFNTAMGKKGVDTKVLPALGEMFRRAVANEPEGSIHAYQQTAGSAGDEFLMRSQDPDTIKRVVGKINDQLANTTFSYEKRDGTIVTKKGTGLSHGIGTDPESAEAASAADKKARTAAGLRTAERDIPAVDSRSTAGQPPSIGDAAGRDGVQRQDSAINPQDSVTKSGPGLTKKRPKK